MISDCGGSDWTERNDIRQTYDTSGNTVGDVFYDTATQHGAGCTSTRNFIVLWSTYRY